MKLLRISTLFKLLFIAAMVGAAYIAYLVYISPYPDKVGGNQAPLFRIAGIDFVHEFIESSSLPYAGSAAFDIDNDGVPEVFVAGGFRQRDSLYKFNNEMFEDITIQTGFIKDFGDTTYGAASVDANKDGFADLFVARDSGIYLYINDKEGWQRKKIDINVGRQRVPVSISLGDFDKDGYVDLFVSCQLKSWNGFQMPAFNNPERNVSSMLLRNNGDNTFSDITTSSGLTALKNINTAVFADLNGDGWLDLVAASSMNGVNIYKNNGNSTFQTTALNSDHIFAYALGLAVGDFNNDGRLDIFASNVGSSVPEIIAKGDLYQGQLLNSKWVLFRNEDEFRFSNIAEESLVANYELGRGAVFADFNLDGLLDLMVESNHIAYPPHRYYRNPGKLLLQNTEGQFISAEESARVENKQLGIAPLVGDFNNDGNQDLVHINLDAPPRAHINGTSARRSLKVDLGNGVEALGGQVMMETADTVKQYRTVLSGEGLSSDQSHILHFGLGGETQINKIEIRYLSGRVVTINNPEPNTLINIAALIGENAKKAAAEQLKIEETVNDTWLNRHSVKDLLTQAAEVLKPQ